MHSKTLVTLAALALTTSLASTGCAPQPSDTDEIADGQDDVTNVSDDQAAEKTGEADQACGFGGFGGWGGFGWGGFGGCF